MKRVRYFAIVTAIALAVSGCEALHAADEPEGILWRLVELDGESLDSWRGEREPSILFDAAKKSASGYNGCNGFFGQYELQGNALKMGPVASTRRACPEAESAVELKFMTMLERVNGWQMNEGRLLLVDGTRVLARFVVFEEAAANPEIGALVLHSSVYTEKPVTLSGGEYRAPAAPGSASEIVVSLTDKRAFGTVAGKPIGAVVFTTSTGGTGTYYELALLAKTDGGWVNTDSVLLGDRQEAISVALEADRVVVELKAHGPKDPLCCPTQRIIKRFAVRDSRLVELDDEN